MKKLATALLIFFCVITIAKADFIDGLPSWAKRWKVCKGPDFSVLVLASSDVVVWVDGFTFSLGMPSFRFNKKNVSTHHNLNGTGPWTKVTANDSETDKGRVIKIEGLLAGMSIVETVTISKDKVVFNWEGKATDPNPAVSRLSFVGNLHPREEFKIKVEGEDGEITGPIAGDKVPRLKNIERLMFDTLKHSVTVTWIDSKNVMITQRKNNPLIYYYFYPSGITPKSALLPGSTMKYEIQVEVKPLSKNSGN